MSANTETYLEMLRRTDPELFPDSNRSGWWTMFFNSWFQDHALPECKRFQTLKSDFDQMILLGMGGSSLCTDVLRRVCDNQTLSIIDSTHPEAARLLQQVAATKRTLVVVASKSGSTLETDALFKYARSLPYVTPSQCVAITDPGSPLSKAMSEENGFIAPFLNPADIGGRYSALSLFGLLSAKWLGLNIEKIWASAQRVIEFPLPAVELGMALGRAAQSGRYLCSIELPPKIAPLFDWIEQLMAESTGKDGKGILPIVPVAPQIGSASVATLGYRAGNDLCYEPVFHQVEDLGGEFLTWEIATIVASHILGVQPFNEPHVRLAKDRTQQVLQEGTVAKISASSLEQLTLPEKPTSVQYGCVLAYLHSSKQVDEKLSAFARKLSNAWHIPVNIQWGPRYLHSTGQLHKGGPKTGAFIVVTAEAKDEFIPDSDLGFNRLIQAQALGDVHALRDCGQAYVLHIHRLSEADL